MITIVGLAQGEHVKHACGQHSRHIPSFVGQKPTQNQPRPRQSGVDENLCAVELEQIMKFYAAQQLGIVYGLSMHCMGGL